MIIYFIVIIILLIMYYLYRVEPFNGCKKVISPIDGNDYRVLEIFDDAKFYPDGSDDAADKLAEINIFIKDIIAYLKRGHPNAIFVKRLQVRYDPDSLVENFPLGDKDTSYVVNKGDTLALCIRETATGKCRIHKDNIIKFVTMHELAHIGTKSIGHGKAFWHNFRFLLKNAVNAGLYVPRNYERYPVKYCGMVVAHSPLYD